MSRPESTDEAMRAAARAAGRAAADVLIRRGMTPPQAFYDILADLVRRKRRQEAERAAAEVTSPGCGTTDCTSTDGPKEEGRREQRT